MGREVGAETVNSRRRRRASSDSQLRRARPHRSPCAIRIGAIADDGYGRFWVSRCGQPRVVRPHRYALAIALGGSIDESVNALHMSDNPICVRVTLDEAQQQPLHVVDGNQSQNLRDMAAKGRGGGRRRPGLWYGPDRAARATRAGCVRRYAMAETTYRCRQPTEERYTHAVLSSVDGSQPTVRNVGRYRQLPLPGSATSRSGNRDHSRNRPRCRHSHWTDS